MMKIFLNPGENKWEQLCQRPVYQQQELNAIVDTILYTVKTEGDKALYTYAKTFDGVDLNSLGVSDEEWKESLLLVPDELKRAIDVAYQNIRKFHSALISGEETVETTKGVTCWRKNVAIEKVGIYIPGGTAPLFSTVLMLGIPAALAGCQQVILCTPSDKTQKINPAILYAAQLAGIKKVYKTGGAQAIAAMAYGTSTIEKVFKIMGPGNQYVTKAKELVQQQGVAIDMPAGPSEVLVIADSTCNPSFVAADLLAQAEHGNDSQVILVTTDKSIAEKVNTCITQQLEVLPRKKTAMAALQNSFTVVLKNLDACMDFSNTYAPEHLILATGNARELAEKVINAGSVFVGHYSCESAGDYASGTNHTLPTNGYARSYSGISVESFLKKITFQEISAEGIKKLGPVIETMAAAENLQAHKNAVTVRLNAFTT